MQLTLLATVGRVRSPGAILTLQPDAAAGIDTFVREDTPTVNSATNTGLRLLGSTALFRQISLIKFDLSTLPVGAVLTRVRLYLYANATMPATQTNNVNRILPANSGWTEAGANWNYAVASTVRWAGDAGLDGGSDAGCSVSGTDFSATLLGSFVVNGEAAGTEFEIELDLTEFAVMVSANHGMVVRGTTADTLQFRSSDHATSTTRPKLVVEYT